MSWNNGYEDNCDDYDFNYCPPDEKQANQDESDDDMLNSVRDYQSKQNEVTCLVHDNPEEIVVENYTKEILSKKKKVKSKKSFEIAPGMLYLYVKVYILVLINLPIFQEKAKFLTIG